MTAAVAALHLGADHAVGAVLVLFALRPLERLVEARPSGPRLVLGVRREQGLAAAGASIGALAVLVPVLAREGALGAALTEDVILLEAELLTPFEIGRASCRERV